jgi:hypothetical protein
LAYRRGYTHGVLAAQNGVTVEEAYTWRSEEKQGCPPGTPGDGTEMFK